MDVFRRPRGRPPGSKNRPKPPDIIVARDLGGAAMGAHLIEVAPGQDVAACLSAFASSRHCGLAVLSATGSVANVTIRRHFPPSIGSDGSDGSVSGSAAITFPGRFDRLSLSGVFLPPASVTGLAVYLSGPAHGQVVGGLVAGPLLASGGPVLLTAASFFNASYDQLPLCGGSNGSNGSGGSDHLLLATAPAADIGSVSRPVEPAFMRTTTHITLAGNTNPRSSSSSSSLVHDNTTNVPVPVSSSLFNFPTTPGHLRRGYY